MKNKKSILILLIAFLCIPGIAQECKFTLQGKVVDESTQTPLSFVNVIIQELGVGSATDDDGLFEIKNLCHGEYNLIISHIGCEPVEMHIHVDGDMMLTIELVHNSVSLESVVVEGQSNQVANQPSESVGKQAIEDNTDKTLSTLLEKEMGVHLLKSGGTIAKPVVHGMFGNRLTILNNGVAQSGQQWGNDHSPEIDPLIANTITVIKGTNALEYGGGNLGSIILVEPKKVGRDPHYHGRFNYSYETNGRANNLNFQLQKYSPALAWKVNGTYKISGDRQTPNHFLTNTGGRELNLAIQLEKSWKEKLFYDLYISTFNTELGVLRGSHIGNLTDLNDALTREVPFFTEDEFRYRIDAPRQEVGHHMIKFNSQYYIDDHQSLQLILAGQINNRKEYDVRRGGRTDIPALSLLQYTFTTDLKYNREYNNNWHIKIGNQNVFTDNTNNPETGIFPLIPDYFSMRNGLFVTANKYRSRSNLNLGIRYDFELQNVVTFSDDIPVEVVRFQNNFHNLSGLLGYKYEISDIQSVALSAGYSTRNPAINELYANGLHQGVSGIEEGSADMNTEKAIKTTLEYAVQWGSFLSLNSLVYYQRFSDYIFLNPQDEIRLTIRGAFPVFKYEQADAEIYGIDASLEFSEGESFLGKLKYSYIRGNNLEDNIPLVNIPSGRLNASLTYRVRKPIPIAGIKLENLEFEWGNQYVFRQGNLLEEQDFVAPPDAYYLMSFKTSTNIIRSSYKFRVFVKAENILNTKYRDYLNRQRYFADDLGRTIAAGFNFNF